MHATASNEINLASEIEKVIHGEKKSYYCTRARKKNGFNLR